MNILEILDRPIAYHRCFVSLTGSITGALFLSQAIYWQPRGSDPDGWFYKSAKEWQEETGMGRYEIEAARKKLVSLGIIEEKLSGVPATLHFRIKTDALSQWLREAKGSQTGLLETSKLDATKPANKNGGNQQTTRDRDYTENTTERERATRFIPPTIKECREEAVKNQIPETEGDAFFDHHKARGWIPSGQRTQMKDWQAAMRQWARTYRRINPAPVNGKTGKPLTPEQADYAKKIAMRPY